MEKIKKRLQKVFKKNGLGVIIECNMKTVNYFDVTFNLNDGTYRPNQKPDNIIQYIHVEMLLNEKMELIFKCRHQNKLMLLRHDSKD